jgi:uncharacterized protein
MNRNMVLAEWSRAREALRAADTLTRNRCYADGISRAYYAMLHAAKAALHIHDVTAESHAAVRRMFGLHLVRPGEIEPEWSVVESSGSDQGNLLISQMKVAQKASFKGLEAAF